MKNELKTGFTEGLRKKDSDSSECPFFTSGKQDNICIFANYLNGEFSSHTTLGIACPVREAILVYYGG